jgi:hypothetical protein
MRGQWQVHAHARGHTELCQFGEVEGGLVAVGEADDHAGGTADGLEVGVEGGQEQVVGLLHAADGP